ncbi:MAG: hypothetical protein H7Y02_13545 [Candidatus Obscuribacterales bacterium]|nr:hypothetical protein [Steroidobacteraceae bacterium]
MPKTLFPISPVAIGLVLASLIGSASAAGSLTIDGKLDEAVWSEATRYADLVVTRPFTGEPSAYRTETRVHSLPEGLAIAFVCYQPADVPRVKPPRARDSNPLGADLVYAIIDFDATGDRAYEFTVGLNGTQRDGTVTNENVFSTDWDARWFSAVQENEETWTVEILIPWSTAPMREAKSSQREIAVQLGRYIESHSERSAWPGLAFDRARLVSELAHIQVASHRETVLEFSPYATQRYNLLTEKWSTNGGLDLLWKPSGYFQLAAALNPDFGQVESDDLVVNFDAIEVFLSDKRPFFTENQGLFDVRIPQSSGAQLLYTRRVGGPADDGIGFAAEIDAALKVTGSAYGLDYGALVAKEADSTGRTFIATRALYPTTQFSLGYLGTYTERPGEDRTAFVNAVDWRASATSKLSLNGLIIGSNIHADTNAYTENGFGASLRGIYTYNESFQSSITVNYLDDKLDFNDFGYMPRNNLAHMVARTEYRSAAASDAYIASTTWSLTTDYRNNAHGDRLQSRSLLTLLSDRRGGGRFISELRYDPPGIDDLISRGNGIVKRHSRFDFYQEAQSARVGKWQGLVAVWMFDEGYSRPTYEFESELNYQLAERFDITLNFYPLWSSDWLIWREDNLLASYRRTKVNAGLQFNWLPSRRHELRLKTQWIVINAHNATPYRIQSDGGLTQSQDVVEDLSVSSFGAQLRYRYEFASQRELYVVYARGGYEETERDRQFTTLLVDASTLRHSDQALVKFRWRF